VNKYDAFIHDYLMQHKQVTLEKIGVLQITADQKPPDSSNTAIPAVQFTFDRKADTEPALLAEIAEKSGKNKALVAADLSSYLEQVRQFINIGKPYVLPGIGAVFMVKAAGYEFSQQAGANFAASPPPTEHYLEADSAESGRMRKRNSLAGIAFVVLVLVLAGVGWGIYSLVKGSKSNAPAPEEVVTTDTPPADSIPATTQTQPQTSAAPTSVAPAATGTGNGGYKFVFETTTSAERAHTRTEQLKSFGDPALYDSVMQNGTLTYRLYFAHKVTAADTMLIRDTLARYFDKPVVVLPD
jgi:hypothetical protein